MILFLSFLPLQIIDPKFIANMEERTPKKVQTRTPHDNYKRGKARGVLGLGLV